MLCEGVAESVSKRVWKRKRKKGFCLRWRFRWIREAMDAMTVSSVSDTASRRK